MMKYSNLIIKFNLFPFCEVSWNFDEYFENNCREQFVLLSCINAQAMDQQKSFNNQTI